MSFPPGYRFEPTDQELILSYLEKKAKNEQVPWNPSIIERDLYGDHATPWYVFSDNDPWDISITKRKVEKTLYVFTKLVKYGKKKTERRAGCGTWSGQNREIINNLNGQMIGYRRMLSFKARENPDAVKMTDGHWIMHEYSLDGVSLNEHTSNDYVICKITRTFPFADEIGTSPWMEKAFGFQKSVTIKMSFPPGYRFEPTDEELILFYLEKKAKNLPVPRNPSIIERDLYGYRATPWYVLRDNDPWDISITPDKGRTKIMKTTLYIFTKLAKYGKNRTERRAGCGTWSGQKREIINNLNGQMIGYRRMLSFKAKENSYVVKNNNGNWTMHEYSLAGVSLNEHTSNDYVICKITRTLMEPRDQPVVPLTDDIGTSIRGGENPRIDEELSKKRYTTVEDCPHANKKKKVQGPSMDDTEEVFGSLDLQLPENKHFSFQCPETGEEYPARDLDQASYDNLYIMYPDYR